MLHRLFPIESMPMALVVTYASFLSEIAPDVTLGSFTGAVIFLMGTKGKSKLRWLLYFLLAFFAGILGAHAVSEIASAILHLIFIRVTIPDGMGAVIAAACTIGFVSYLRDNPTLFLRIGKRDDKSGDQA